MTDFPYCEGTGYSPIARALRNQWFGYTYFSPEMTGNPLWKPTDEAIQELMRRKRGSQSKYEAQRLANLFNSAWCYNLDQDDVLALYQNNCLQGFTRISTAKEVNQRSIRGFGHDEINAIICIKARCKKLEVPIECSHCQGSGET